MFTRTSIAIITLLFSSVVTVQAAPKMSKRLGFKSVITENFPDPCIIKPGDTYYAFATGDHGNNVQIASSSDFNSWKVLNKDALPKENIPPWVNANSPAVWAPDVYKRVTLQPPPPLLRSWS